MLYFFPSLTTHRFISLETQIVLCQCVCVRNQTHTFVPFSDCVWLICVWCVAIVSVVGTTCGFSAELYFASSEKFVTKNIFLYDLRIQCAVKQDDGDRVTHSRNRRRCDRYRCRPNCEIETISFFFPTNMQKNKIWRKPLRFFAGVNWFLLVNERQTYSR